MRESAVILHWSGALAPAQNELTDLEIERQYGGLMQSAVSAFRDDPSYIVQMAESAASLKQRRESRQRAS